MNNTELNAPRYRLGIWPTPFCRLEKTEILLGMDKREKKLYIKRDDLNGLGAGGNKVRCLEYLIGAAIADGCDTVIASGPLQSNLCCLAAAAAAKAGLKCVLVFNGSEPDRLTANQLLNSLLGCRMIRLGPVTPQERSARVERLAAEIISEGGKPYIITNGGANGTGAIGYTHIISELSEQYRGAPGERLTLFVPGGNGGIASGMIFGNYICGSPFDIVVISVEDTTEVLTGHILAIIQDACTALGIDPGNDILRHVSITDAYRGDGWGINTAESSAEVSRFAKDEGIFIENVYTSKVVWGMKDMIAKGEISGDACYIHTGGFGSLFSQYD